MPKQVNHGHAVYFEFHDAAGEGRVAQFLLIGHTLYGDEVQPFRLLSRAITPASPQLTWRSDIIKPVTQVVPKLDRSGFIRTATPEVALLRAKDDFENVVGTLDAMTSLNWKLYREPFVLQVSQLDIADLKAMVTPKKLIDRLRKVRIKQGWSALPAAAPRKAGI